MVRNQHVQGNASKHKKSNRSSLLLEPSAALMRRRIIECTNIFSNMCFFCFYFGGLRFIGFFFFDTDEKKINFSVRASYFALFIKGHLYQAGCLANQLTRQN